MIARYDRFCQCNSCNWRCFGENVSKVKAQTCSLRGNNFSVKYWMPKHYKGVHVMVVLSVNCVAAHWGAAAQHANILLYTTKLGDTRANTRRSSVFLILPITPDWKSFLELTALTVLSALEGFSALKCGESLVLFGFAFGYFLSVEFLY